MVGGIIWTNQRNILVTFRIWVLFYLSRFFIFILHLLVHYDLRLFNSFAFGCLIKKGSATASTSKFSLEVQLRTAHNELKTTLLIVVGFCCYLLPTDWCLVFFSRDSALFSIKICSYISHLTLVCPKNSICTWQPETPQFVIPLSINRVQCNTFNTDADPIVSRSETDANRIQLASAVWLS